MKSATEGLATLSTRASEDAFFLGFVVRQFQEANDMTDDQVASWLQCTQSGLTRLFLCRSPNDASPSFQKDISSIAAFTGCDAHRLLQLVREIAALDSLREEGGRSEGLLLAARDQPKRRRNKRRFTEKIPSKRDEAG